MAWLHTLDHHDAEATVWRVTIDRDDSRILAALTSLAELDEWELVMLHEACRVADRLDALDEAQRPSSLP